MGWRLQRDEAIGLLMISGGLTIVVCLLYGRDVWPQSLPGVLIGLSMISFGWSMRSRGHRRRGEVPEE